MSGVLSGIGAFGKHIGSGASYGAFLAPLGHIASRLHAIGNQARFERNGAPGRPMILVCAHAGLKTGEDGPTHADPQPLQLLQENFPPGAMITLTPWDPCGDLAAFGHSAVAPAGRRRAVRHAAQREDPRSRGAAPRAGERRGDGRLPAAQGARAIATARSCCRSRASRMPSSTMRCRTSSEPASTLDVYYVASAELFDLLPREDRERIFPPKRAHEAIGITGFTLPTMYRWIQSDLGRAMTLHPYMNGQYPGSGTGRAVIAEAGLDGESQYRRIVDYLGLRVATV